MTKSKRRFVKETNKNEAKRLRGKSRFEKVLCDNCGRLSQPLHKTVLVGSTFETDLDRSGNKIGSSSPTEARLYALFYCPHCKYIHAIGHAEVKMKTGGLSFVRFYDDLDFLAEMEDGFVYRESDLDDAVLLDRNGKIIPDGARVRRVVEGGRAFYEIMDKGKEA